MNKKGLSILLALSMVFSLNSMAFAEEAVVSEEAVVESVETSAAEDEVEVTQSADRKKWSTSLDQAQALTSFKDGGTITISGTSLLLTSTGVDAEEYSSYEDGYNDGFDDGYDEGYDKGYEDGSKEGDDLEAAATIHTTSVPGVVCYHGKKITAQDLGLFVQDKDTGYGINVKKIKVKNAKATTTGLVTFSIATIGSAKDVWHAGGCSEKEAKEAYKSLKANIKTAKNQTFTAYIAPTFISDSISESAVKALKKAGKTLSAAEISKTMLDDWGVEVNDATQGVVFIKTKNSTVKKVQLVYFEKTWVKSKEGGTVYKYKVKTRNLKKDKDYKVNGDSINFDGLETYSGQVIKAKT